MKIIITMAGMGSRFKKVGLDMPKHEIVANGRSLFEWSLLSLKDFFNCEFIFIVRAGNYNSNMINNVCANLNIYNYNIYEIDALTEGQASTVMQVAHMLDDDDEIAIYNIDTYIQENQIKRSYIDYKYDGYIPCFEADGDKWSFILPKDDRVLKITEKVRISNLGTVGFYYFKRWKTYKDIYTLYNQDIKNQYKETYIAPMYQYMINRGDYIGYSIIEDKYIHILGTPEDIEIFDSKYKDNSRRVIL